MTHKGLKLNLLTVAMVFAVGTAQAEMTLAVPAGSESQILVGSVAERSMQISFTAAFSFAAGALHLTFDPGLGFLPDQSTLQFGSLFSGTFTDARLALNGIVAPGADGCAAGGLYSYCASFGTPGQVDFSVTLPPPPPLPEPDPFEMGGKPVLLKLVFRGNAVGEYAVHYALDAVSNDFSQMPVFEGDFSLIRVTPVPEPASYALMLGGLLAVGALARQRRGG